MRALQPLFALQRRWSLIPAPDELLIEATKTGAGQYITQGRISVQKVRRPTPFAFPLVVHW